ncbi:hypothetical protein B0J11DRAFT_595768 [Dendryphion nanum]|uniref:Accumulation-associated protein n=1 Tax=Dendryphion nanum TaxID=256645 RepID=A0A9P9EAT3_9PLEO|nr:hypothetical protein B0J11DRAFT_595768 [Dendryphion nanum]
MHFPIFTIAFCVLSSPLVSGRPHPYNTHSLSARSPPLRGTYAQPNPVALRRRGKAAQAEAVAKPTACAAAPAAPAASVAPAAPAAGEKVKEGEGQAAAGGEAGEGEAGAANEVELPGAFDVAVAVAGGELKQDIVYTPSTVGSFEYEFQAATADSITVSENTAPAPPPAGFEAIEPNSYIVALAESKGAGLTLSKIDYIFDVASAGLVGKDITKAQVGRLCAEAGAFVISAALGELEFELEENEVTLNLNKNVTAEGEWGIFLPVAAAAVAPAAPAAPAAGEAKGKGKAKAPAAKAKAKGNANANAQGGSGRGDNDDEEDD